MTTMLVALPRSTLLTVTVKLTKVLLATGETSTVLLIFKTTGTTVTLVLFLTSVSFSLQVTLTLLVKLPALFTLTRAVIHNSTTSLLFNLVIFHLAPLTNFSPLTRA